MAPNEVFNDSSGSPNLPVAIIGAGPGGLLLARYLQMHSVPCKIYEKCTSWIYHVQNASLNLHEESGLMAMKEAGLMDGFLKFARKAGGQTKVLDNTGKVWLDFEGSSPEIDRIDLRNILIDSLEPDTIQWDHEFVSARLFQVDSPLGYVLNFVNAASVNTDILIGADGAWSQVRPLITSALTIYSGITFIELAISDVDARFPHFASLVGQGTAYILSDNKGLILKRNSRGTIHIYAGVRVPETWLDEHPPPDNPAQAPQVVASLFKDWFTSALDLITSADNGPIFFCKASALPPSLTWTTALHGITLLGDAAHAMSPFASEGVDMALLDAYELGKELVNVMGKGFTGEERMVAVDKGLRKYEKAMWVRAQEKAEECVRNLDGIFAKDAPNDFIKSYGPPPDDE